MCRLTCGSEKAIAALRRRPCRGTFEEQTHPSHSILPSAGGFFCTRCGAYAVRKLRTLRLPCPGCPRTSAQADVKRRLVRGLPPTSSALHHAAARDAEGDAEGREHGESGSKGMTNTGSNGLLDAIDRSYYRQLEFRRRARAQDRDAVPQDSSAANLLQSEGRACARAVGLTRRRITGKRPDPGRAPPAASAPPRLCTPASAR